MHPIYRWGGSYPYHANPMHYAPNDDPRAKDIPSHMKMDPSTLSSPYQQPWPYGGNYCYPGPQECHGGCNHGYFGNPYSFRPPYPCHPPPPPSLSYHAHGFYPDPPFPYPAYSFPPPHYSVEQPRYDYDKNAHGSHHCYGCNCNHQGDEKKLRIEQKEPEIEKKTSDSSIPFLLKDYPYPIMWVPPGFMNTESKANEKENHSHNPVPLEPLEPSKQSGNGETNQDQQGGDNNRLPFPIFLFPSKNDEVAQKGSPFYRNDDKKMNNEAESKMSSKPAVQKMIPVKQLGTEDEKKSMEIKAKSEKTDNGMDGKASPKSSKLPPVCLRLDPLPRKKNSSRSPSPPADKRSKGSSINESKSTQQLESLKKSKEEQSEKGVVCKEEKKKLSENEAVLIIQSACRGFQVRKSKPITKLRQIREVGKQVIELRNRIQDFSSICIDEKQKLIIGETIMSLLLKLDTIQGLHPVVREVRKGVAKELVGLQEKLDSIKSETSIKDNTKRKEKENDDGITIQEKSETPIEEMDNTKREEKEDDDGGIHERSETPIEDNTKMEEEDDGGIHEKPETPIEDSTKKEDDCDGIQEKSEIPIEDMDNTKREEDDDDNTKREEKEDDDDGIIIQEKSETPIADNTKREEDDDDNTKREEEEEEEEDYGIQEKFETPIEDETKREEDDGGIQEKSETPIEDNTKREENDDDGITIQEKFETQLKMVECGDAEGGGLTNMELQNEEISGGEVDKTKQLVDDDDDDVILQDKFGDEMEQKGVEAMEAENSETVEYDTRVGAEASDMNMDVEPPHSTEEKHYGVEVCDLQSEDKIIGMVDDDVKVMEEMVKKQMGVIRELTERVKNLEKKLLKNSKKINKKKKNRGRGSGGCIVEEDLS